jgi:hypothetical protein
VLSLWFGPSVIPGESQLELYFVNCQSTLGGGGARPGVTPQAARAVRGSHASIFIYYLWDGLFIIYGMGYYLFIYLFILYSHALFIDPWSRVWTRPGLAHTGLPPHLELIRRLSWRLNLNPFDDNRGTIP